MKGSRGGGARGRANSALVGLAVFLIGGCMLAQTRPADPLSAEEHNDLGVAYYGRREYSLATREFRRALALRPQWPRALLNLGDALLAMGQTEGAIAVYERAHEASPDDPAVANNLAWALLQHRERWPEAEPLIRAALGQDPQPRGYYLDTLGVALLRKDAPGEALTAFRAALADPALRLLPARALVLEHTGQALARLGDPAGAERCRRAARALLEEAASPAGGEPPPPGPSRQLLEVGARDSLC